MHTLVSFFSKLVLEPGVWGALGLLAISAADEFVAFVPSSLILAAELLFLKDPISLANLARLTGFVALPIAVGTTVGSLPLFWAAYAGGKPALDAVRKKWKLGWADIEKFERKLGDTWKDDFLFFFLRATPLMPTLPVTAAVGLLRMRVTKYTILTTLGIALRVVITLIILRTGGEAVISHAFRL